jgi:hypothetical protein
MYYALTQKMQGIKVKIGCRIRMQKAFSLPEAVQRYCKGKKRLKEQKQTAKQKPRFTFSTVNCGLNVFALWSAPYATANEYSSVIRQRV